VFGGILVFSARGDIHNRYPYRIEQY